jgi:hypothetical protein
MKPALSADYECDANGDDVDGGDGDAAEDDGNGDADGGRDDCC